MESNRSGSASDTLPPLVIPKTVRGLLEGKASIVNGASHGIGAGAAMVFAEAGSKVVLAARSEGALEEVARAIRNAGGSALVAPTDVTDPTDVKRLVDLALEKFGRLDAAFNNAGDGHLPAPLAEVAVGDFDRAVATNVRGTFLCMKYEIPAMLRSGGGAIVNMSSTAGLQGVIGIAGYVAGKHAIIGLTRSGALDYARQNIRVNAVAPGHIFTERLANSGGREQVASGVPMGRVGDREEVATVVAWLCSDLSSFVTGAVIPVDGGRMSGIWFASPAHPKSNSVDMQAAINSEESKK